MRKKLLWIDDMRNPHFDMWKTWIEKCFPNIGDYDVIWAMDFDYFKMYIDSFGLPDIVCFDHDLGEIGDNERNGYTCANYIVDYCIDHNIDIPTYAIQSSNPVGEANIRGIMNGWHKMFIRTH